MTIHLLYEEEGLLGLCSFAGALDEDLHDMISNINQTDVLEPRANEERVVCLVKARQFGDVVLVDVSGAVLLNQLDQLPVVKEQKVCQGDRHDHLVEHVLKYRVYFLIFH